MTTADTTLPEIETPIRNGEAGRLCVQRLVKRLVLKSCGKHYGESGGDCHKCRKPDCRTKEGLLAVLNATVYPNTW